MSALRMCIGGEIVLIDPHTREAFAPRPLPVTGSGPVEVVRPATSAPAPRPARAELLSDAEIRERHVKGALAAQEARRRNREAGA